MLVTHMHHGLHGSVSRSIKVINKMERKRKDKEKRKMSKEREKTKKREKGPKKKEKKTRKENYPMTPMSSLS